MTLQAKFNHCLKVAQQYYGTIDKGLAALILATCASSQTHGDPVWLMVIGPPSTMKSEHLHLFAPEPYSTDVTAMTKFSLIPKKGAGLLQRTINKCMVISDFSAVLGMNPNDLKEVFGILRRAFDGKVTKDFSGHTRMVEGKFSFLGASTEELERHRGTIASLGERFVYVRAISPTVNDINWLTPQQLALARTNVINLVKPIIIYLQQATGLIELKENKEALYSIHLIAKARTPIHRNYRTNSVELTPEPEGIIRMYAQTEKLKHILGMLGYDGAMLRVYQGSIPLLRTKFIQHIEDGISSNELALRMRIGTGTVNIIRTDLQLLELLRSKDMTLTTDGRKLKELLGFTHGY